MHDDIYDGDRVLHGTVVAKQGNEKALLIEVCLRNMLGIVVAVVYGLCMVYAWLRLMPVSKVAGFRRKIPM